MLPEEQDQVSKSDIRRNLGLFLLPVVTLILAYLIGRPFELIAFLIWGLGGLHAFYVLINYGFTDSVSFKPKEAALWFLFGNLLVFFVFCLKPV